MGKYFQKFNGRLKAWVKMERLKNGLTKIVNVKQFKPKSPFANVPKK